MKKIRCWASVARRVILADDFAEAFEMECLAMKRVRNDMGLTNVEIMIPFVRTLGQAEKVIALAGQKWPQARPKWFARHHDVRSAIKCDFGRTVP